MHTSVSNGDVDVDYIERDEERLIVYRDGERSVELAQHRRGYGMVVVRTPEDGEIERYYGLDMAVDHAAELCGRSDLPIPSPAADMGI